MSSTKGARDEKSIAQRPQSQGYPQRSFNATDITGFDPQMPIEMLVANDLNWRRHPDLQNEAMRAALKAVGIIQSVIWNKTTSRLVDGHLRLALAIEAGYTTWPTTIVEMSEDKEKIALATYDPLSAMAVADAAKFKELTDGMGHVDMDDALTDLVELMAMSYMVSQGIWFRTNLHLWQDQAS